MLTFKVQSEFAANKFLSFFVVVFFFFSEKIRLDISCESSAKQMIHMKFQVLFKKEIRISSAAVVLWRVNDLTFCILIATENIFKCLGGRVVSFLDYRSWGTGMNTAGGEIQLMTALRFIAQSFSLSPFHHIDMTWIMLKGT